MRAAVVQLPAQWAEGGERLVSIAQLLQEAAGQGADIAVMPEVSLTGYDVSARNYAVAETIPGPLTEWFSSLTQSLRIVAIAGMVEREGADLYNTFVVAGPSGWCGHYRKIHISTIENACWNPGQTPGIVQTDLGRIGLAVCADMVYRTPWKWYRPGASAGTGVEIPGQSNGIDLVAICAAWPDFRALRRVPVSRRFRETHFGYTCGLPEKISRVLGVPVLFSNYCGRGFVHRPVIGGTFRCAFAGGSRIVSGGYTVEEASQEGPRIIYANVLPEPTKSDEHGWKEPWLPNTGWLTRCQFYGGEMISKLALRGVYLYRRSKYGTETRLDKQILLTTDDSDRLNPG